MIGRVRAVCCFGALWEVNRMIEAILQFGMAGLMGVLWVWERSHSRQRERQLSATHERLMRRDEQLNVVVRMVRKNTKALVEFERTQRRLGEILEGMRDGVCNQGHGR